MKKQLFVLTVLVFSLPLAAASQADDPFLLKDINPAWISNPLWLTDVNGILFFQADDGVNGIELWKSNGTEAGTVMVKDIYPGSGGSNPSELINISGTLFFRANDGLSGYELWKSDGTEAGTVMVKEICPPDEWEWNEDGDTVPVPKSSYPRNLTDVNGTLFFQADGGLIEYENRCGLWKSDGTEEGTVMVKEITPEELYDLSNLSCLTNVNGTLFFIADDEYETGRELWKSDGTEEGTVMVKDINPDWAGPTPSELTNVNGTLFFQANDDTNGDELWKSDGTEEGTVMVKDINPEWESQSYHEVAELTDVNGILFFIASDGINGIELWKSDGTETGTVMVKDINSGAGDSLPSDLINVNGTLFFTADNGINGYELWKSDGTEEGTCLVKDIRPGLLGSDISDMANINGILFFTADNGANGDELWKSDGTEAGTRLVSDIYPGSVSSYPALQANVSSVLFFSTDDFELWMYLPNDECQNALQLSLGQTFYGSSNSATGEDLTSCAYNDFADVWFYYVPAGSGQYTIIAGSGEFDTTLAVFNACGGNELACNDDFTDTDSQISLDMAKGKRYYIRLAGFNGLTGAYQLTVLAGSCPQYIIGDLNGDCTVDMQDLAVMASEWLTCNLSPPELCQ